MNGVRLQILFLQGALYRTSDKPKAMEQPNPKREAVVRVDKNAYVLLYWSTQIFQKQSCGKCLAPQRKYDVVEFFGPFHDIVDCDGRTPVSMSGQLSQAIVVIRRQMQNKGTVRTHAVLRLDRRVAPADSSTTHANASFA
jgi:hypothetical protein